MLAYAKRESKSRFASEIIDIFLLNLHNELTDGKTSFYIMAKQKPTFTNDLLQSNTIIEVVKLDLKGNFIGIKDMEFEEFKNMKKQKGYFYRAFQKKFSQFKK